MSTTKEDIKEWFEYGVKKNKKIMIIWCDTFEWSDAPEYYDTKEAALKEKNRPKPMEKYMESYDLTQDMESQINKFRNHVI